MANSTSVALGDELDEFLSQQVASGRFSSPSDVVMAGLRLLEEQEARMAELQAELAKGEASGDPVPFEGRKWLADWRSEWEAEQSPGEDRPATRRA